MNYLKIYNQLIDRARNRTLEGYSEMHHIIPRCMNGSNDPSNIAILTAEEHYIAHLLLVKIHPMNKSLWYAANMMANRNNKLYAWIKQKHAQVVSEDRKGKKSSVETRQKISKSLTGEKNPRYGKKHTEEAKESIRQHNLNRDPLLYKQIGDSRRGKLHTVESKQKMSKAISERWEGNRDGFIEEQRRRASTPKKRKDGYFKTKSDEHAQNISNAALKRIRYECPHCSRMITKANIKNHMKVHNVSI